MKRILYLALSLLAFVSSIAQAQVDTSTTEKKVAYKISLIKSNSTGSITPTIVRNAISSVADMSGNRVSISTTADVRAGKVDTSAIVYLSDVNGIFRYNKLDTSSEDDSTNVVRFGNLRYTRSVVANQWTGKKIIYTGTSIPWSFGANSYPLQLGKLLGANVINNSISGSTIIFKAPDVPNGDVGSYGMSGTYAELIAAGFSQNYSYQNRIMPYTDADMVVIDHGTNDAGRIQTSLGTINSTDKSTFYGAYNSVINAVHTAIPRARIVLVTPPNLWVYGGEGAAQTQRENMQAVAEAIRAIAKNRGLPLIDLAVEMGITSKNVYYWTSDGLHPKEIGAKREAGIIYRQLLNIY